MTGTTPIQPSDASVTHTTIKRDAVNRAVRTLVQGLLVDMLANIGLVVATASADIHWTKEWWVAEGILLGKTVVITVVSYIGRFLTKPAGATK